MMSALPPRSGESPSRRGGGVSRLAMMQARFQAKQLEEKEEKLIHMLEEKQVPTKQEELIQRVNYGRDSANSINSLSSTASSNSVNGGVGQRPNMYGTAGGGGGRVRQMFEQRRNGNERHGKGSPVGWDKSYPLDPVEAVNNEVRTPIYKQNVTRNNSYNKYSGNYGVRNGPSNASSIGKRGMSLDRLNRGRQSQNGYGYGQTPTGLVRAQSQANITGNSSSEDSYTSARPYSGFGYNNGNTRSRKPSGGSVSGRYPNYEVSPEDSPPMQRRNGYQNGDRDYTRPLPPTYRRQARSRVADPSPSRHSYHDSAYSSHSSHSSDNPAFSVIPPSTTLPRPPLSTQSSPAKSYSRQNSFTYDSNQKINSRTFRKQKSPMRNRSPSLSPSRSAENSDETDLATNDDYATRVASRTAEREREEERRRMQVEMRKREQELLARIKEQQKELDAVKAEKSKVEKQLSRQEREREEERRHMIEKQKNLEQERQRIEMEEKERRQFEERERRLQEEQERNERQDLERRDTNSRPHERVLRRDKASPAHLRGRRPPSLVSSDENEDDCQQTLLTTSFTMPSPRLPKRDIHHNKAPTPTFSRKMSQPAMPQTPTTSRRVPNDDLQRRPSLRRNVSRNNEQPTQVSTLGRRSSFRKKESHIDDNANESIKQHGTSSVRKKEPESADKPTPIKIQRTPSIRRKLNQNKDPATKEVENKGLSLSRIRAPSREQSFDSEEKENQRNNRTTKTYISNSNNNTVKIEIKDAKKTVPPSPAIKKKGPAGGSTPARRSVFAPKPRDDLISCKNCQRNFAEDRIEKHEEICLKTSQKKRKTFDMTKARVKGTDAASYVKNAAQLKAKEAKDQKKSDWRKKREEFINTLKAAKEAQRHLANGGSLKDLPPPPPMDTSDYIQCPHCSRRFSEAAAERHIPKCKDIKSNKKR